MFEWFQTQEIASYWIAGISFVTFVAALFIVPWVVVRIPADYFAGQRRFEKYKIRRHRSIASILALVVKNILGGVFVLVGIVLLVLPGQGLLTILLGLAFMNFPGKFQLERWIVSRGPTLRLINHLRRKRGRAPLILKDKHNKHGKAGSC